MAENYREQNQEEAEGIVDAGGFENEPGTGMIAEDQETAAAADVQPEAPAYVPVHDDEEAIEETEASENVQPDLHENTGSGLDWAVIVIILLIIIGCLSFGIANAQKEEAQLTIAEQQAVREPVEYVPTYEVAELPEGVAASVNGEFIEEDDVTAYIANFRLLYGLEDDGDWNAWLSYSGYTPESLRDMAITVFITQAIVEQGLEEYGLEVPQSAVDEIYNNARANFESDEEWAEALKQVDQTEESFRQQCWEDAAQLIFLEYLGDQWYATSAEEDAAVLESVRLYYPEYAEVTTLVEVPAENVEPIREMVKTYAQQDAFREYVNDLAAKGALKMSAMPAGLPYNTNSLEGIFQAITDQVAAQQAD